ncbi:hypothetical protein LRP67_15305 [Nocardioides sp. cx-169]|uniref:hypothetical protein n=1 Tax=Nocardioides sp. cx-169 TaxID=2899080 RepID=UPI001E30C69E|nr:hypothetical protein [Nocardioides sp. cx-169]MCD4535459.1 hypothetical protein [Nocardioides sp. cx-169]
MPPTQSPESAPAAPGRGSAGAGVESSLALLIAAGLGAATLVILGAAVVLARRRP